MGRHSISLVLFCLLFGFLLGLAGFLSVAYLGGFVEAETPEAVASESQFISATDRLEKYRCRAGETKQVIMGGIEDGYNPAGDEPTTLSKSAKAYLEKAGTPFTRSYDDPSQNKYFSDAFKIPARTYHGIMTIGLEERSRLKNDRIVLGYADKTNRHLGNDNHGSDISTLLETWQQADGYVWSSLDVPKIVIYEKQGKEGWVNSGFSHLSILDAIRRNNNRVFEVHISDDTIVDFIGFALCLEPADHKGAVFYKYHYSGKASTLNFGTGFVNMYSTGGAYDGDVYCTELRPIPCINDQNLAAPNIVSSTTDGIWSGGYIKFTDAVAGNTFKTEDEVDAYCGTLFGQEYRSVNSKDGSWMGALVGYGEYPEEYDEYWVHFKDSPHMNCWAQRIDYDDVAALEAKSE